MADPHPASELLVKADRHAGCGGFVEHHVRAESSERGWQHRRRRQRRRMRRGRLDRRLQHDAVSCRQIMKAGKPVCPPRPREQDADTGERRARQGEIGRQHCTPGCRPQLERPQGDPDNAPGASDNHQRNARASDRPTPSGCRPVRTTRKPTTILPGRGGPHGLPSPRSRRRGVPKCARTNASHSSGLANTLLPPLRQDEKRERQRPQGARTSRRG